MAKHKLQELVTFIIIESSLEKRQTKVVSNAFAHPVWNETHKLPIKSLSEIISFSCFNEDEELVTDTCLGLTRLKASNLLSKNSAGTHSSSTKTVELHSERGSQCTLKLKILASFERDKTDRKVDRNDFLLTLQTPPQETYSTLSSQSTMKTNAISKNTQSKLGLHPS